MTEHACVICAKRPHDDGRTCCTPCLDRVLSDLERLGELTAAASFATGIRANGNNHGPTSSELRAPINLDALDAALGFGVLPRLEAWERMWREEVGLARYGQATENDSASVARSVAFLRAQAARMAETDGWPIEDFAADLNALRWGSKADPELGRAPIPGLERFDPEREHARAGVRIDCPGDHPDADGTLCGYHLTVDPVRPREEVPCRRCGTTWTSQRLVLVAKYAPGGMKSWATAQELGKFLEVAPATIGKWSRRGKVDRMRTREGWVYDIHQASQAHLSDSGLAG